MISMVLHTKPEGGSIGALYCGLARSFNLPTGSDAWHTGPPDLPKSDIVPEPKTK